MPLTDAQGRDQNASVVPEDQMLVVGWLLLSLKLAFMVFPWLGIWNRRLIAADTLTAGCFRSSRRCGSRWTLVCSPDRVPAPDALALKWGEKNVNGDFFKGMQIRCSDLANWLKIVNTKDETYWVKKGILTGLSCWTKSLWSHCFLSQKEMPV